MFDASCRTSVLHKFVIIAFPFFDFSSNTLYVRHKHRQSVYRNTCKTYHSSFWSHQVKSKMLFMLILYLLGCKSRIQPNKNQGKRMHNNERQWNFIESVTNARNATRLRSYRKYWLLIYYIGGLIKLFYYVRTMTLFDSLRI